MLFSVSHEPSVPYQFLVYRNKWSGTLFPGLRSWDGTHAWISLSSFYPTVKVFSHNPLLKIWIVFWPCGDCYSLGNRCYTSGFCSFLNFFFFCLKLPCKTIYKLTQTWIIHPCSTRGLGLPCPSLSLASSLEHGGLPISLSCPGFQDLLERRPCALVRGTSPILGLYWFST